MRSIKIFPRYAGKLPRYDFTELSKSSIIAMLVIRCNNNTNDVYSVNNDGVFYRFILGIPTQASQVSIK